MNLLAALARIANQVGRGPYRALDAAQRAQMKQLDAVVRAQPDRPIPHFNRARYLDLHGADFEAILAAVRPGVELSYRNRKSCINAHYLLEINREDWDDYARNRKLPEANYLLAYAVASFEIALQRSPDLADWNATRPPDWDALAELNRAIKLDFSDVDAPHQTPDTLKVWAHALAVTVPQSARLNGNEESRAEIEAARIYTRALRLQHRDFKPRGAAFVPGARNGRAPAYKQLAWWNFIVELAPGEPRWWRERARWLSLRDFDAMALRDLARAIELAPDEPELYEMRAKLSPRANWWDVSPHSQSKTADYLRAIRLRIAAGEIDGAPEKLRAQAEQLRPMILRNRGNSCARARAFYTLAIAATPDDATLYLAHAQLMDAQIQLFYYNREPMPDFAYRDYARALALDETLNEARAGIADYLRHSARRPTAHEQIEALLEARAQLRELGVKAELATAIVGEVERALAH